MRHEAVAMLARVAAARPAARLDGFLVQPMVRRAGAVELLIGLVEDPVFGPLIAFGQGGTAVEIIHDSSLELPPLNGLLARRLMARTRVWQLLQAYRGKPAAKIDAIIEVLIPVGQLAADHPEIRELDINPLLADADGVVALDARLHVAPAKSMASARLAIAPYPQHLETAERLRDGTQLSVRPMRPEDEPMLHDLAEHMNPRGSAIAVSGGSRRADPSGRGAVVAARLRPGLGAACRARRHSARRRAFLRRPGQPARRIRDRSAQRLEGARRRVFADEPADRLASQRGIGELVGEVLRENEPMLQMCRELGFTIASEPADPALLLVNKRLPGAQ